MYSSSSSSSSNEQPIVVDSTNERHLTNEVDLTNDPIFHGLDREKLEKDLEILDSYINEYKKYMSRIEVLLNDCSMPVPYYKNSLVNEYNQYLSRIEEKHDEAYKKKTKGKTNYEKALIYSSKHFYNMFIMNLDFKPFVDCENRNEKLKLFKQKRLEFIEVYKKSFEEKYRKKKEEEEEEKKRENWKIKKREQRNKIKEREEKMKNERTEKIKEIRSLMEMPLNENDVEEWKTTLDIEQTPVLYDENPGQVLDQDLRRSPQELEMLRQRNSDNMDIEQNAIEGLLNLQNEQKEQNENTGGKKTRKKRKNKTKKHKNKRNRKSKKK